MNTDLFRYNILYIYDQILNTGDPCTNRVNYFNNYFYLF